MFRLSYILPITCIIIAHFQPVYSDTGNVSLLTRMFGAFRHHVGLSVLTVAATGAVITWLLNQYSAGQRLKGSFQSHWWAEGCKSAALYGHRQRRSHAARTWLEEFVGRIQERRPRLKGLTILYCAKDGISQALSEILRKDARRREIIASVIDVKTSEPEDILAFESGHLMVLVLIGSDQAGAPSEDAVWFHKWLDDAVIQCGDLSGLDHAVVCVGGGQSANVSKMALDVEIALTRHGSSVLLPLSTLGEHPAPGPQGDAESAFVAWTEQLWTAVEAHYSEPFKKPCTCSKKSCCTKEGVEAGSGDEEGHLVDIEDLVNTSLPSRRPATDRKSKLRGTPQGTVLNS